jgi:small redox-active disulfide protein 2
MKNVKVLGTGCTKCKNTVAVIEQVAEQQGIAITLEKVEDPIKIMSFNVMSTPAVVVDDMIVHKGSVPTADEVAAFLS